MPNSASNRIYKFLFHLDSRLRLPSDDFQGTKIIYCAYRPFVFSLPCSLFNYLMQKRKNAPILFKRVELK